MSTPKKKSISLGMRIFLCGLVGFFVVLFVTQSFSNAGNHRTGPRNACINNLRQIDGAKEQWALGNYAKTNAVVTISDITPLIKGGFPKCPSRGTYTIGPVSYTHLS